MKTIDQETISNAYSYLQYRKLIEDLLAKGRTTNDDNSESMLHYTRLNLQRMSRWEKRAEISDTLVDIIEESKKPVIWLVLTEGWCGDASQVIPFIWKAAELSENIELKLILRDQNPEIMDAFLTKGSRSVPKLIALNESTLEVLGTWGPRPEEFQEPYMKMKKDPDVEGEEASKKLHLWYARDKGALVQKELGALIRSYS